MDPGKMGGGKGRRKRKERKVTVLKGCEAVEIGAGGGGLHDKPQYFAVDRRVKVRKTRKKGRKPGMQGTGSAGFGPP